MKRLVVLSGPQAAGKSHCLHKIQQLLQDIYPCFPDNKNITPFILQEARQIVVHKYHAMGAIFLTPEQEREIIEIDFFRMNRILEEQDESLLYFDECNIFTLAHARAHGIELSEKFFERYISLLKKLNAVVIFIDLSPEISWLRRKESYQSRLLRFPEEQRSGIMHRYFDYLQTLYPSLKRMYDKISLPKTIINSNDQIDNVIKQIVCFMTKSEII